METIRKSLQAINITSPEDEDDGEENEGQQQEDHGRPLGAGDRVLLMGANGFIGGHILKALLEEGLKVRAVVGTRNEEMMVRRLCAGSEERVQVIIAGGGVVGDKFMRKQESNIVGILDSMRDHNPMMRRVILTSVTNDLNRDRESSDWNPTAATALKTLPPKTPIERAAWKYMSAHSPNFTLASVIVPALFGPPAHDPPTTKPASEILRFIRSTGGTAPINTMGPWSDVRDVARAHVAALMRGGASGGAGEDRFFAVAGMYSSKQICKVVEKWFPQLIVEGRTPRSGSVPGAFEEMEEDEMLGGRYEGDNRVTGELGVGMRGLEESVVDTVESLLKFEEMVKGYGKGMSLEAAKTPTGGPGSSHHLGSCTCGECATKMRHRRTSVDELDESTLGEEGVDKDGLYTLVEQAYEGSVSGTEPATSNTPRSLARGGAICVCAPGDQCTCTGRGIVEERPMRRISVVLNKPDVGEMLHHS